MQWNPLQWASDHWTQIGIGSALAAGMYKIFHAITKVRKYLQGLTGAQSDLEHIKNNHLPHLQVELEKINGNLSGLRDDMRGHRDDLRAILTQRN